uniref:HAT C-terminal dimerisation domain-containing protein n=1 Tax=Cannabis sativa TaxID=3483 RepID=A0A803PJV5_CANSA
MLPDCGPEKPRAAYNYCGTDYATDTKLNETSTLWAHVERKLKVDNASSNDVALRKLKGHLLEKDNTFPLNGEIFHMRCSTYILNSIVSDGLKELNEAISSIRNAVRYVRSSPARMKRFKESCMDANIDTKALLCLDVAARWNSTYMMLEAAIKFKKAFDNLEGDANYTRYFDEERMVGLQAATSLQLSDDIEEDDLEYYLNDRREKLDPTFDILQWWKHNGFKYPVVARMAKEVLVVQMSTVASELAFSAGGRILDAFRSSLSPRMVEALIYSKNWYTCEYEEPIVLRQYMNEIEGLKICVQVIPVQ